MAAGQFNIQKASGGITSITVADGATNTSLVLPESGTVATTASATETSTGLVELATTAETQAGTDDARAITPLKLKSSVFGLGQTWQNVTASRVAGTTYTNSTGKPIVAIIDTTGTSSGGTQDSEFYVSGVLVARGGLNGLNNAVTIIIPNGATYSCTLLFGSITYWAELR